MKNFLLLGSQGMYVIYNSTLSVQSCFLSLIFISRSFGQITYSLFVGLRGFAPEALAKTNTRQFLLKSYVKVSSSVKPSNKANVLIHTTMVISESEYSKHLLGPGVYPVLSKTMTVLSHFQFAQQFCLNTICVNNFDEAQSVDGKSTYFLFLFFFS